MKQSGFRNNVLFTIVVVLIFAAVLLIFANVFPAPEWDNIIPAGTSRTSQIEPAVQENTHIDSLVTLGNDRVQVEFYIIVESLKNLTQAQQRAEKFVNDFNVNFIVLPPTAEGYYRISCGKYSSFEEAESAIKSIKTNISSDAWIFSAKE
jgi:hypothetical protein